MSAIAVKERPILFSGPMVRAILEGRKTQTRRIMKPQPIHPPVNVGAGEWWVESNNADQDRKCPYGKPGDLLWVREAHSVYYNNVDLQNGDYKPVIKYRADYPDYDGAKKVIRWTPSIHMKRAYSRITLEVTGVRVERLQDISDDDSDAEGVEGWCPFERCGGTGFIRRDPELPDECRCGEYSPKQIYKMLWEQINGADSWEKNPWVWVIEFKKL